MPELTGRLKTRGGRRFIQVCQHYTLPPDLVKVRIKVDDPEPPKLGQCIRWIPENQLKPFIEGHIIQLLIRFLS